MSGRWCGLLLAGVVALSGCASARPRSSGAAHSVSAPVPQVQPVITDVPQFPRPVTSFGAALHAGAVYALGGYFGVPHAYSREGQSGELIRFDPASGSFQSVWHGDGVQGAQLVSTQRGLLRVGGMRADNARGQPEQLHSVAEVALWDEREQRWRELPALPRGRSSHAAVELAGKLYVIGGWTLAGARGAGEFAQQVLVLDLATGSYRELPQPFRARALAAAVLAGKIIAIGGIDAGGQMTRAVHVLDPETGSWSSAPDYPEDAFGIAAAADGSAVYASAREGIVRRLAEPHGSFEPCAALAFPRFFHQLIALGPGRLLALGGISGMHEGPRIAHAERIDLKQREPRVLAYTLHNPGPAKNRQAIASYADELIVFGGNRSLAQHDFAPDDFVDAAFAVQLADMQTRPLPSFPARRQTVQTLLLDDALLALGGFGHDGSSARAHADAYLFDLERESWQVSATRLPSPRTQFGLVAQREAREPSQNWLWVFGGLDFDASRPESEQFRHPLEVLRARHGEPFTDSGVRLPHARRAFAGAALGGRYYLVGGMAAGFEQVPSCDVFEFATASWSSIPCPALRISGQLSALDGKLYLAGGSSPDQSGALVPNRRLEVFDPAAGAWSTLLEELPIEPHHLSMVSYRHALLLYSAQQSDARLQLLLVVPAL